jgi:transposase
MTTSRRCAWPWRRARGAHRRRGRATGAEAMIAHLKLVIAKLRHDKFGASSERGRKLLDQLELELGELVATVAEDAARAEGQAGTHARSTAAQAVAGSAARPSAARAGGAAVTLRLPLLRRQAVQAGRGHHRDARGDPALKWKVIQTVREKFSCRSCETITQPPAPFHPIARGGPDRTCWPWSWRPSSASTCR